MAQAAIIPNCEICDSREQGKWFCTDCQEILCEQCKENHLKGKKTKHDTVVPVQQAKNVERIPLMLCEVHKAENISIYCQHCQQLICVKCLSKNHRDHKWVMLEEYMKSNIEKLENFQKTLSSKILSNQTVLNTNHNITQLKASAFNELGNKIKDKKAKIIQEVTRICDRELRNLSSMLQKDCNERSAVCNEIQTQTTTIQMEIQNLQRAIDTRQLFRMDQAMTNASKLLQDLKGPQNLLTVLPRLRHSEINPNTFEQLLGSVHIQVDIQTRSMFKIKDKTYTIKVIVPVSGDLLWVAGAGDRYLTLVNRKGLIIREAVDIGDIIVDAKGYDKDIVMTTLNDHKVVKMTGDCSTVSTFSDLTPFFTKGLCVTYDRNLLVCLKSTKSKADMDAKVVRLGHNGDIIQTIQHDNDVSIFSWPYRITELTTGEIIVADYDGSGMRIVSVSKAGHHQFTWKEDEDHNNDSDDFYRYCLVQDDCNNVFVADYDNSKVLVMKTDRTGFKCLLDSQGIQRPYGIAVDSKGRLLIGCKNATVHVVTY